MNIEQFVTALADLAGAGWTQTDGGELRCTIAGHTHCPITALDLARSGLREAPAAFRFAALRLGLGRFDERCIRTASDRPGRYPLRQRLERAVGLGRHDPPYAARRAGPGTSNT